LFSLPPPTPPKWPFHQTLIKESSILPQPRADQHLERWTGEGTAEKGRCLLFFLCNNLFVCFLLCSRKKKILEVSLCSF
jgi:hypothetical protein